MSEWTTEGSASSPQEKWDAQIQSNRRSGNALSEIIAKRMETCPNNPRKGGDGFDNSKGSWTDRRQGQFRTGSVKPLGRRLVRKALWRGFGRAMRKGGL